MIKIYDLEDSDDNGEYLIYEVNSSTKVTLNRDFPTGGLSSLSYTAYYLIPCVDPYVDYLLEKLKEVKVRWQRLLVSCDTDDIAAPEVSPFTTDSDTILLAHFDDSESLPPPWTLADSSGNGYDGEADDTWNFSAPYGVSMVPGVWGNALKVDFYRQCFGLWEGPATSGPLGANFWKKGTLEFMFQPNNISDMYPTSSSSWDHFYFASITMNTVSGSPGSGNGMMLRISNDDSGVYRFNYRWKGTSYNQIYINPYDPADDFAADKWTKIKVTWDRDAAIMKLFIDDVLRGTDTFDLDFTEGYWYVAVGTSPYSATETMQGKYEELRYSSIVRP
jgi:hypothetical protein